jgi:hypothetical protein
MCTDFHVKVPFFGFLARKALCTLIITPYSSITIEAKVVKIRVSRIG